MRLTKINLRLLAKALAFASLLSVTVLGQTSESASHGNRLTINFERALQLLAARSGKAIVWVGAPPIEKAVVLPRTRTLAEAAGAWADEWEAMVIATPDAVFFHAPKTFDHVRPAHFDPQLPHIRVIDLLNSLPPKALARFPLGPSDTPQTFRAESLKEAVPLTLLERESPGFEKGLRELLKQARARARGAQQSGGENIRYDVPLAEAPAEQLYARLFAETQIYCVADEGSAQLSFPVSLSKYAVNSPLFIQANEFIKAAAEKSAPGGIETLRFTVGELVRSPRFAADRESDAAVVVDSRLEQIPVTLSFPKAETAPTWAMLETGLGVERRDLGETIFYGPWMDEDRYRRFSFISRWARSSSNGGRLWTALFTPYVARPRSLSVKEIGWQRLETIIAELRRRQARGDKEAANLDLEKFLEGGRVSFGQAGFVEILYVGKPDGSGGGNASPVILGRHNFFLD
jgi:hypothetical protein